MDHLTGFKIDIKSETQARQSGELYSYEEEESQDPEALYAEAAGEGIIEDAEETRLDTETLFAEAENLDIEEEKTEDFAAEELEVEESETKEPETQAFYEEEDDDGIDPESDLTDLAFLDIEEGDFGYEE